MRFRLVAILLAALAAVAVVLSRPDRRSGSSQVTVTRVVDGDTLRVSLGGRERYVRLLGIDTPETHRPGTPIECGGPEASASMARLVPPGTQVRLATGPTQDAVDR